MTRALFLVLVLAAAAISAEPQRLILKNGTRCVGVYDASKGDYEVWLPKQRMIRIPVSAVAKADPATPAQTSGPIAGSPFGPVEGRRSKLGENTLGRDQTATDNAVGDGLGTEK